MVIGKYEAVLTELERSKDPPDILLPIAANILELDLDIWLKKCYDIPVDHQEQNASESSFREQWLLRWFLKQVHPLTAPSQSEDSEHITEQFVLDPRSWALLLYLINCIPSSVCVSILFDRGFPKIYSKCIEVLVHRTQPTIPQVSANQYETHEFIDNEGPPRKKQRLEFEENNVVPQIREEINRSRTVEIALNVACYIMKLFQKTSHSRRRLLQISEALWSLPDEDISMFFGASICLLTDQISTRSSEDQVQKPLTILQDILSFWDLYISPRRISKSKFYKAFNTHCLWPCLGLLNLLQSLKRNATDSTNGIHRLEQLIVITTALPMRTMFFEKFLGEWKIAGSSVNWNKIQSFVAAISDEWGEQRQSSEADGTSTEVSHMTISLLFGLAVRTAPQINIRQRLREQPWLDSLLLALIYLSSPSIPRLTMGQGGFLEPVNITVVDGEKQKPHSSAAFEELIKVAIELQYRPSSQVLEYLVSAALWWVNSTSHWELIASLIQLDINSILPNSGISSSENCLHQLCMRIQSSRTSISEYTLIKDQIIVPLQKGFIQARDIARFVNLWQDNLQKALLAIATRDSSRSTIPAVLVWYDEDLSDVFASSIKLNQLSVSAQRLAHEILDLIQDTQKTSDITLQLLADVSIFTILLDGDEDDFDRLMLSNDLLQNISRAVLSELRSENNYQGQRWRLWSLLAHLWKPGVLKSVSPDIMAVLGTDKNLYCFKSMKELKADQSVLKSPRDFHEYLQCFLLVLQQAKCHPDLNPLMTEELRDLRHVVQTLDSAKPFIGDRPIWNGRMLELDCPEKLVGACVAYLVSELRSFETEPVLLQEITLLLLQVANVNASAKQNALPELSFRQLGNDTLLCEELVQSKLLRDTVLNQLKEKWQKSTSDRYSRPKSPWLEILAMSPKSDLDSIAEVLTSRIFTKDSEPSIDVVAEWLSILDVINKTKKLTVLQPQNWNLWMENLKILSSRSYDPSKRSCQVAAHFLNNLLRSMWKRAWEIQPYTKRRLEVISILAWTSEAVMSTKNLDYGLSTFLAIRIVLVSLERSDDRFESFINRNESRDTKIGFLNLIVGDLQNLLGNPGDPNSLPILKTINSTLLDFVRCFEGPTMEVVKILESATRACAVLRSKMGNDQNTDIHDSIIIMESRLWRLLAAFRLHRRTDTAHLQLQSLLQYEELHPRLITTTEMRMIGELVGNYVDAFNVMVPTSIYEWVSCADIFELDALKEDRLAILLILTELAARVKSADYPSYHRLVNPFAKIAGLELISLRCGFKSLLLEIESSKIVLTSHSEIVNQNTLEILLDSISNLLSGTNNMTLALDEVYQSSSGGARSLYDRICTLIGILLSRFRRRLADRYHILIPILQNLLKCFFHPGNPGLMRQKPSIGSNDSAKFHKSLPVWIRESGSALPESSAEHYSRLLSSICNPTISAARSSHKRARNELKDETKKVRTIAGQYMQYVLVTYTRSTLDGQISPAVKEKLMPGMYAILSSMSRDLMKSMNTKMDPSNRAMFKTLYQDWIKFGKWDNN